MEFEVLDYLRGLQQGEYGILHIAVLILSGAASMALARHLFPNRTPFETPAWIALCALAPVLGLVLTSTTYPCPSCEAPPGCQLVRVGVPFPQAIRERNPALGLSGRCWLSLTPTSATAFAGNFILGTLGLPLLLTLFRPKATPEHPDPFTTPAPMS